MDHHTLRQRLAQHRCGANPAPLALSTADSDAEVDWHARVGHLRRLIQARRRRLGGSESTTPLSQAVPGCGIAELSSEYAIAGRCPTFDQGALGTMVANGVRLVDERLEVSKQLPASLAGPGGPVLCFDTETTGLRGGAGLWVWMVGLLIWRDGHWRLHQWWLESPAAERRYLELLMEDFGSTATLVSFNGKSFDLPHLATRLGLNDMHNPLPELAHLDLLHAMRRRYGKQWPNCRLRTAEERLLDLYRSDDLPGSEAPRSWREFLTEGRWQGIAQVLAHNRQDLLSLARLMPLVG